MLFHEEENIPAVENSSSDKRRSNANEVSNRAHGGAAARRNERGVPVIAAP